MCHTTPSRCGIKPILSNSGCGWAQCPTRTAKQTPTVRAAGASSRAIAYLAKIAIAMQEVVSDEANGVKLDEDWTAKMWDLTCKFQSQKPGLRSLHRSATIPISRRLYYL